MSAPGTFRELIRLWPSVVEFGRDTGVGEHNAKAFVRRASIPAHYHLAIIRAAKRRGLSEITPDLMLKIAANERRRKTEAA